MENKTILGAVVVVAIIAIVGWFVPAEKGVTERAVERATEVGAVVGPDIYDHVRFFSGSTHGGQAVATTSSGTAVTLTTSEFRKEAALITWTPNTDVTVTTMASSAAPFNDLAVGQSREVLFYNASTSANATITFAAGTGIDLQEDEAGSVIVNGLETAKITYFKKANNDVAVVIEPYQVGD